MGLRERVAEFLDRWLPMSALTRRNSLYEPPAIAQNLDVDSVLAILRQAEAGDTQTLFALYRDIIAGHAHAQTELFKRKLAVLGDPLSFQPARKDNPVDQVAADFIKALVEGCPGWIRACGHLLDSTLWPVAVVEKVFAPSRMPGVRYELDALVQVPPHLLDYTEGRLLIWDVDATGQRLGTKHEPDPTRYIIHRGNLLNMPDNWGGPMRAILFWYLFSIMDREWWARFLDRFGAPFVVAKYDQADDQTRVILNRALSRATKTFGLVVSKSTSLELVQAASSQTGDAFEKFHLIANREISKLILGQTLSSEAQATGMGSGVAKGQSDVRQDYRQFDAAMLAETLGDQLIDQLMQINGIPGGAPKLVWSSESSEEAQLTGTLLASLTDAGLRVTDEAIPVLSQRLGIQVERIPTPTTPSAPGLGLPGLPARPLALPGPVALQAQPYYYFEAGPSGPSHRDATVRLLHQADAANDQIVKATTPALAEAFRGAYAPVRLMILESTSAEDLERRIRDSYPDTSPTRVAGILSDALTAFATNALQTHGT